MEAIVTVGMRLPRRPEAATMPRVSTIQPTDEDLLARVAEGDRDAFGDLYRRYARAVLGLAERDRRPGPRPHRAARRASRHAVELARATGARRAGLGVLARAPRAGG